MPYAGATPAFYTLLNMGNKFNTLFCGAVACRVERFFNI
jgi:hypothetical protein